jgi:hypothetical protein
LGIHGLALLLFVMLPSRATLFAAAGELVHGRPSPRFRRFYTGTALLVAGFDVGRLPFLFVRVTGFIALGHSEIFVYRLPTVHSFTAKPIWTVIAAVIRQATTAASVAMFYSPSSEDCP